MEPEIRPLTPQRIHDFFEFFDHVAFNDHPEWGCGCYCCYFHFSDHAAWDKRTPEENSAEARQLILSGSLHGLLAYDGDRPVGWCHYDLQKNLPGVRAFYPELSVEDPLRGEIVCFTVAQGWRGKGVATRLLTAALADLKASGVTLAAAYSVLSDDSQEHNYTGPFNLYQRAGFTLAKEIHGRARMEKPL
jgi:ribosomal protein S18 acetylase RimI-like enzyme